jgi:tetratricopeptide (TPR) repeat protein
MPRLVLLVLLLLPAVENACAQRSASEYFRIAKYRYDRGDLEQALQYCRFSTEADPRHMSAWLLTAEVEYALGNYPDAIKHINKAFALDENQGKFLVDYHVLLARAYARNKDYAQALEAFEQALRIKSSDPEVYYERAVVYSALGRPREAIQDLDKAIAMAPEAVEYYALRSNIRWEHFRPPPESAGYQQVVSDIDIAIALCPKVFDYHRLKYRVLQQNPANDLSFMLEEYTYLIRQFPGEPEAYRQRGLLYMQEHDFGHAVRDFTASIDLGAQDPDCYRYRALCYHNMFQYGNALADFTAAIDLLRQELKNNSEGKQTEFVLSETYFLRGNTYLQQKKQSEACVDFEEAYALGSKKGYNYYRKYCNMY